MMSRFTEKAQEALQQAQKIMFSKQHTQLDVEHVFLALLQQRQGLRTAASRAWVDDLYGKFAGDPLFAQAMKLGRRYRKSKLGRTVARKAKPRR